MTRDLQGASIGARRRPSYVIRARGRPPPPSGGGGLRGSVVAAAVAVAMAVLVEAGVGEDRRVLVLLGVRRVHLGVGPELAAEVAMRGLVEVEVRQQVHGMLALGLPGQEALASTVRLQHRDELTTEHRAGGVGPAEHERALRTAVAALPADDRCRLDLELAREAVVRAGLVAFEAGLDPHMVGVALALLRLSDRVDIELARDRGRLGRARPGDRHPRR